MWRIFWIGTFVLGAFAKGRADESTAQAPLVPTVAERVGPKNRFTDQLRNLVRLPQVAIDLEPQFNRLVGVTALEDVADIPGTLAANRGEFSAAPTNALRELQLARLARAWGAEDLSSRHQDAAIAGFRAGWQENPTNSVAPVGLAQALWFSGEASTAEKELRTAALTHSNRWEVWLGLGEVLGARSLKRFTDWGEPPPANALAAYVQGELKPQGDVLAARSLATEADECVERARKLAPEDPAMWAARVPYYLDREMRRRLLELPATARAREAAVAVTSQATALPEVEAALRLQPADYRLLGLAIQLRILPDLAAAGARLNTLTDGRPPAAFLRSEARAYVTEKLARLESLVDPSTTNLTTVAVPTLSAAHRAGAAEMAARFQLILFNRAQDAFRLAQRALALDPTRRAAFEIQVSTLLTEKQWPKLADLCQERLQLFDEPWPHLIGAKAEFNAGHKARALTQLAAASEKFPKDRLLLAAWAAARLAVGSTHPEPTLGPRLATLFPDPARTADPTDGNHSVVMTSTISQALDGEVAEVKRALRSLLGANPQDDYAVSVLELIRERR